MAKQKQKGASFEKEVAELLTATFNKQFERTAHSGAWLGGKNSFRKASIGENIQKAFLGDIIVPEGYQLVIECKNYAPENFSGGFHFLLQGKNRIFEMWIDEVLHDSNQGEIPYMLFFKISRQGSYVAIPSKYFEAPTNITHMSYLYNEEEYFIFSTEKFQSQAEMVESKILKM